ncbi:MAG TPA: ribosomal protein S18-alanine N-acetyltransferase [Gemmatimonadaceae bacterium]|nr:ribosomal protein S18-alanine N-acetyltransferase [Gemmatimonadaceae bacterium]
MSAELGAAAGTVPAYVALRPARRQDLDAVMTIEQAAFTDPWSRSSFVWLFDDARTYFVVAVGDDDRPVGYVAAWFVADEGEVATLAVAEQYRGHGIGAQLVDAVLGEARRRGAAAIYLEVRESNVRAQQLYAAKGFVEVGRRRHYYRRPREDARVLRRSLADAGREID